MSKPYQLITLLLLTCKFYYFNSCRKIELKKNETLNSQEKKKKRESNRLSNRFEHIDIFCPTGFTHHLLLIFIIVMATQTSTSIEHVLPSIPPSIATTPAPSIHESVAASEIPLVPIERRREGSTERQDGSDEERGNISESQPATRIQSRRNSEVLASDLAPVDGGKQAWTFLAGCFVLEAVVFGYAYSSGAYQDYHLHDPRSPMYGQPAAAISAIGTLVIGTQCFVPILIRGFVRTFPHLIRRVTLICIGISVCSLIVCSFMTKVIPMLIFQSIYGLCSGIVFTPGAYEREEGE